MNNFKSHFKKAFNAAGQPTADPVKKRRHMGALPDVSTHSATGGKAVPDMWKTKKENAKLRNLKNQQSGRVTLNKRDLQEIQQQFPQAKYDPNAPKKLGNTGIVLRYDPNTRQPVLEK